MRKCNRNFQLILIGQIISLVGGAMLQFALLLFILDVTESAEIFATILAVSAIPALICSPFGGAIADRFHKRNLMILLDLAKGIFVGGLMISFLSDIHSIVLIAIVMILLSIIMTTYHPVVSASIPLVVKQNELLKANGIVQAVGALSDFIGPILGGILYAFLGIDTLLLISTICFFLSAFTGVFIYIPFKKRKKTASMMKTIYADMKEGFTYVKRGNPILLKLSLVLAIVSMLAMPMFTVGMPYIIRVVFEMSEEYLGFAQGVAAFGMILGGAMAGTMKKWLNLKRFHLWIGLVSFAFIPVVISVLPNVMNRNGNMLPYIIFTIGFIVMMFAASIINIFVMALTQEKTPSHLVVKVIAILTTVIGLITPVGQLIFGFLIEHLSNQLFILFLIISIATALISIVAKRILNISSSGKEDIEQAS